MSNETHGDRLECPYCGYKDNDCNELSDSMDDDGNTECGRCEKEFMWQVETTRTWTGISIDQPSPEQKDL